MGSKIFHRLHELVNISSQCHLFENSPEALKQPISVYECVLNYLPAQVLVYAPLTYFHKRNLMYLRLLETLSE